MRMLSLLAPRPVTDLAIEIIAAGGRPTRKGTSDLRDD
jgi:hypothetical protein